MPLAKGRGGLRIDFDFYFWFTNLITNVILQCEAFGRRWHHESGALINGISYPYKKSPRGCLVPFHQIRTLPEVTICVPESRPLPHIKSAGTLTSDFATSTSVTNTFLLFTSHPPYCILLCKPKWTQTSSLCLNLLIVNRKNKMAYLIMMI